MSTKDFSQLSIQELFRMEAEGNSQALIEGLLALERNPRDQGPLEVCMRAAHSLKGAARLVDIDAGVILAHAMEDFLVAAQEGRIVLRPEHIDFLLKGVDLMMAITREPDLVPGNAEGARRAEINAFASRLGRMLSSARQEPAEPIAPPAAPPLPAEAPPGPEQAPAPVEAETPAAPQPQDRENGDRVLRVTVGNLNQLLGLAGESLVESRWLKPFGESLLRLKRMEQESLKAFDRMRGMLQGLGEQAETEMAEIRNRLLATQDFLSDRLAELDISERHSTSLAHRLYDQALACRMRPFADGTVAFPRMVRDVARSLGKEVLIDILGSATLVDRDILERLDAPLGHILRNAVDHGIEPPGERLTAGKPKEGRITMEARHSGGALHIEIHDDGRGIDPERIRSAVVTRKLAKPETAARLSDAELLEFLFLPGFSMRDQVTVISGRGVGLDAVQTTIKEVRGKVRIISELGRGTRFHLHMPLTLSVVRTLLVEIGGEPYAFPLPSLVRTLRLPRSRINVLEGRQHFEFEGQHVALVSAHQILANAAPSELGEELAVVVVGEAGSRFGLVVDRFLGGRELVLQPLDPRLGIVKDINAAALMEDGSPVLVVDVDDIIRSMEKLASSDRLTRLGEEKAAKGAARRKRVLVVDDSLTVRELERKLLDHHGYEVEVAVDGMDGWNAARSGRFDLVVTDIDMPRMDGIELVARIKKDGNLQSLLVMILSYKDRDEDRRRGLDAGADYYLAKGSFHDDTLVGAVADLIGAAT